MRKLTLATAVCTALLPAVAAHADEREDLMQLRATTLNLIELLVKQGVLTREGADTLLKQAQQQAAQTPVAQPAQTAQPVTAPESAQAVASETPAEGGKQEVRVGYVPQFVRDEIRDEVRIGLREDVTNDVLAQAKNEAWGVPGALPEWTSRFKFSGDMRLRAEGDLYNSNNAPYGTAFIDFNKANSDGGIGNAFLNTEQDRWRGRLRLRLGVDAKVTNNVTAAVRIASGSTNDPVSTNQTMGDSFRHSQLVLDRAFLKYDGSDVHGYPYLTLWGGRMPNPWMSTDLVWDDDLNFEGVAGTYRWNIAGSNSLLDIDERTRTLYLTFGGFLLDEAPLSSKDKSLLAAQVGTQWLFQDQSSFEVALAYYDYINIDGRRNELNSRSRDYTAPGFMQKGNSLFDISNDATPGRRFGLASDFRLVDLTFKYDLARFAPMHLGLLGDYVVNVGYDSGAIRHRLDGSPMYVDGTLIPGKPSDKQNEGYQLKLTFGWPSTLIRNNWQAFLAYRYLERDAVVDAFTDSDFHLGGTNNKGWILGGSYGLTDNTYLMARYMSADEIDGPPLGIDVFQVDLNAKF